MEVKYKKTFLKKVAKLPAKVQRQLAERIELFTQDPYRPLLNNHALVGKYKSCRSINITGDYRAIYIQDTEGGVVFLIIGTHPELYG